MMEQINLYEAKTKLSSLVDRVAAGEEVAIAKHGVALAKLVPIPKAQSPRQPAGALGVSFIADDFDDPDPDIIALFAGS